MGCTILNIEKDKVLISYSEQQNIFSWNQVEAEIRIGPHARKTASEFW